MEELVARALEVARTNTQTVAEMDREMLELTRNFAPHVAECCNETQVEEFAQNWAVLEQQVASAED